MDREEGRIGLLTLLAQGRQHDRHHRVVALEHREKRLVEASRAIALGRRQELVFEAEGIEEGAQARVVVVPEALMRAERIGHLGQGQTERGRDQLLVRDVLGHLAQAVHVVGEREKPRRDLVVRQDPKGMAHHARAGDFAEGADMGQPGGPVARLEQGFLLPRPLQPLDELARLLEGPGGGVLRDFGESLVDGEGLGHGPGGKRA